MRRADRESSGQYRQEIEVCEVLLEVRSGTRGILNRGSDDPHHGERASHGASDRSRRSWPPETPLRASGLPTTSAGSKRRLIGLFGDCLCKNLGCAETCTDLTEHSYKNFGPCTVSQETTTTSTRQTTTALCARLPLQVGEIQQVRSYWGHRRVKG